LDEEIQRLESSDGVVRGAREQHPAYGNGGRGPRQWFPANSDRLAPDDVQDRDHELDLQRPEPDRTPGRCPLAEVREEEIDPKAAEQAGRDDPDEARAAATRTIFHSCRICRGW